MTKCIFDFDNTVVFTNSANNSAYNNALELMGLKPVITRDRLTRDKVFEIYPDLSEAEKIRLVSIKQECFSPAFTILNNELIGIIRSLGPDSCVLWSCADRSRVEKCLKYYLIENCFGDFITSPKVTIPEEVSYLCKKYLCSPNDLIFYDDNREILNQLEGIGCRCVEIINHQTSMTIINIKKTIK